MTRTRTAMASGWLVTVITTGAFVAVATTAQQRGTTAVGKPEGGAIVLSLSKTEAERLSRLYFDVINSHNVDRLAEILAEHYIHHGNGIMTTMGLDNFKQTMAGLYRSFPDVQWFLDDILVERDRIALYYHATASNVSANKRATVYGMEIDRFQHGKMVETWNVNDLRGMMEQLGLVPPRP